jgi:hypothetical protein
LVDTKEFSVSELAFLVGRYTGSEQVHPSPWTEEYHADAAVTGRFEVAGSIVVQHQVQQRDGVTTFEAVNVFQVDPGTGETLLYSFDSLGYPPDPPARGRWHGPSLVLQRVTARGSSRTSYTPGPDGYTWTKTFRTPGAEEWSPMITGHLTEHD